MALVMEVAEAIVKLQDMKKEADRVASQDATLTLSPIVAAAPTPPPEVPAEQKAKKSRWFLPGLQPAAGNNLKRGLEGGPSPWMSLQCELDSVQGIQGGAMHHLKP